jgi:hypothetical protein
MGFLSELGIHSAALTFRTYRLSFLRCPSTSLPPQILTIEGRRQKKAAEEKFGAN